MCIVADSVRNPYKGQEVPIACCRVESKPDQLHAQAISHMNSIVTCNENMNGWFVLSAWNPIHKIVYLASLHILRQISIQIQCKIPGRVHKVIYPFYCKINKFCKALVCIFTHKYLRQHVKRETSYTYLILNTLVKGLALNGTEGVIKYLNFMILFLFSKTLFSPSPFTILYITLKNVRKLFRFNSCYCNVLYQVEEDSLAQHQE